MSLFDKLDEIATPKAPDTPVETPAQAETPAETPTETPAAEAEKPVVAEGFKTDFFEMKAPEPVVTPAIDETGDQLFDRISKQYGFNISNNDDIMAAFGELKEVKQKYEESDVKNKDYESVFAAIPLDVKAVLADVFNGSDYRKTMKDIATSQLDYTKDASAYSKDDMITMYNADMTVEDLEDLDDKNKDRLYNAAVKMYNADKSGYMAKAVEFDTKQKESAQKLMTSINESVGYLKEQFPGLKKEYLDNIQNKVMKSNYATQLLKEDGTWKKDAAVKIAMAEYGSVVIEQMRKQLEAEMAKNVKLAKSEAKEEIVKEMLNDTPDKGSHSTSTTSLRDEIKKSLPFLT